MHKVGVGQISVTRKIEQILPPRIRYRRIRLGGSKISARFHAILSYVDASIVTIGIGPSRCKLAGLCIGKEGFQW